MLETTLAQAGKAILCHDGHEPKDRSLVNCARPSPPPAMSETAPCGPPRSPVCGTQAIRQPPGMAHEHTASTADGTTIAWSRSGSGGPVVLVHGITESAGSWDPVTDRLATTNDVITPDLRVHGKSGTADAYDPAAMVSAIAAVNAATDVATPHLVGHVLGGAVVSAAGPALRPTSVASIGHHCNSASSRHRSWPPSRFCATRTTTDSPSTRCSRRCPVNSSAGTRRRGSTHCATPDKTCCSACGDLLLTEPQEAVEATVDAALPGCRDVALPYLALFGIDPGVGYTDWLGEYTTIDYELWDGAGHYRHLVDPDRVVA